MCACGTSCPPVPKQFQPMLKPSGLYRFSSRGRAFDNKSKVAATSCLERSKTVPCVCFRNDDPGATQCTAILEIPEQGKLVLDEDDAVTAETVLVAKRAGAHRTNASCQPRFRRHSGTKAQANVG